MIAQRRIDRHRELIKRHKRIGIAQLSGIKQVSSEKDKVWLKRLELVDYSLDVFGFAYGIDMKV
jgi:hypothetical protein